MNTVIIIISVILILSVLGLYLLRNTRNRHLIEETPEHPNEPDSQPQSEKKPSLPKISLGELGSRIHELMNSAGYICTKEFSHQAFLTLIADPTPGAILFGPAGTGKSFLPETLAKITGRKYFFMQCFPGTREDDLLYKFLPSEGTTSGITMYPNILIRAIEAADNEEVIICLDEWDKTKPSADSFLLSFLQNGHIDYSGYIKDAKLSNITIYLTMNNERVVSDPLLRRLQFMELDYIRPEIVLQALSSTHRDSEALVTAINIYQSTVSAALDKPATIQELRQFLDAVKISSALNNGVVDMNQLIFQFITKDTQNHNKFINFINSNSPDFITRKKLIEMSESSTNKLCDLKHAKSFVDKSPVTDFHKTELSMIDRFKLPKNTSNKLNKNDIESSYGFTDNTEKSRSFAILNSLIQGIVNPNGIGNAEIKEDTIILNNPLSYKAFTLLPPIQEDLENISYKGELFIYAERDDEIYLEYSDLLSSILSNIRYCFINKYRFQYPEMKNMKMVLSKLNQEEMSFMFRGKSHDEYLHVHLTQGGKMEIITSIPSLHVLQDVFYWLKKYIKESASKRYFHTFKRKIKNGIFDAYVINHMPSNYQTTA